MNVQNLSGQVFGQYELREMLGFGGMGAAYLGFQKNLERKVAVKVLFPGLAAEAGYIERFYREAKTAASLEHAHIVPVYDYGVQGDISYVVMRMLIVDQDIDAALLYASISADEQLNLAHFEEDGRGVKKISAPDATLDRLSPANYLDRITAKVSINHGDADSVVPVEWSIDLCEKFKSLNLQVECTIYEDQPHTFQNSGDTQFIANSSDFFDKYLKN